MARILVGCSGFSYAEWRGRFYPRGLPQRSWLEHYAAHFRTVEINGSFYRYPSATTVRDWRDRTPPGFEISLKAHRLITHRYHVAGAEQPIARLHELADLLGERIGCLLFQLPPTVQYDLEWLEAALRALDPARRNALELRHRSWWRPETWALCRRYGVAFVSVSAPPSLALPEELVVTAPFVYLRFHGTTGLYHHDYTRRQLDTWARRIEAAVERPGVERVYAYFNNDVEAFAPSDADALLAILRQHGLAVDHGSD